MGPPRRPNGVVVVGRGGPAEGMSFRACPEANDPQLGPTTAPPFLPEEMGEKKGRGFHPQPPKTGAHGGGALYRQGRNRARIDARFPGGFVTGAAAPWAARIGIAPQTLKAAALYRSGPPGRRRCHASEIPSRSRKLGPPRRPNEVVVVGRRRPSGGNELSRLRGSERSVALADDVGAHLCVRPHVRGRQYGRRPLSDTAYTLTHKGATS